MLLYIKYPTSNCAALHKISIIRSSCFVYCLLDALIMNSITARHTKNPITAWYKQRDITTKETEKNHFNNFELYDRNGSSISDNAAIIGTTSNL